MSDRSEQNGTTKTNGAEVKAPFLIGVAGGTASGKVSTKKDKNLLNYVMITLLVFFLTSQSTVCKRIMEQLGQADKDHSLRQVCFDFTKFFSISIFDWSHFVGGVH